MSIRVQFSTQAAEDYQMGMPADLLIHSRLFNVLSLGTAHTLIHELGHAIAWRMLSGSGSTIALSKRSVLGALYPEPAKRPVSNIGMSWVDVSGPLADILFSLALIWGAFALAHCVRMPTEWKWVVKIGIAGPAAFWIAAEYLYAGMSAVNLDQGDFGKICEQGPSHFMVCALLCLAPVVLTAVGLWHFRMY
jgi:hypothetical protein